MSKSIILLFVEWESEKQYFSNLFSKIPFIRWKFSIIIKTNQWKQENCVKEVCKYVLVKKIDPYKKYIVLDLDVMNQGGIEKLLKQAKDNDITILFSKPCFEFFLLLHYRYDISLYTNKQYYKELTKEMSLEKAKWYEKNKAKLIDFNVYDHLFPLKLKDLFLNFKRLEKYYENESSTIHLLNPYTNIISFFDDIWLTNLLKKD